MGKRLSFDVVIHEEKVKGKAVFVARCEPLGIVSQGFGIEEALKNIKDAVELYLEEMPEKRELLLKEEPVLLTRVFL